MKEKREVSIFLDSGAYSAFTQGVEIDLNDYVKFVYQWKEALDLYAVLDDIRDPNKTWESQVEMERQGLHPLPTYHYGEDPRWLKKYLARYPYLAIGGMVPIPNASLLPWLDRIFKEYLTDRKGAPIVKVHGFGMTSVSLMKRYPWYSVDSTSWILASRFGSIYVPVGGRDIKVCISEKAGKSRLQNEGQHFSSLSGVEKRAVEEYLHRLGYTLQDVAGDYKKRDEVNIRFFTQLEQAWEFKPLGAVQPWFAL